MSLSTISLQWFVVPVKGAIRRWRADSIIDAEVTKRGPTSAACQARWLNRWKWIDSNFLGFFSAMLTKNSSNKSLQKFQFRLSPYKLRKEKTSLKWSVLSDLRSAPNKKMGKTMGARYSKWTLSLLAFMFARWSKYRTDRFISLGVWISESTLFNSLLLSAFMRS